MEIEHPIAKMMVEVAKTQAEEVGDGTTTAVVIAGELLKKAGLPYDATEFKRVASMRSLYHWNADAGQEY
jgi:hypothetical protein